jgi:recombination endonuclease VII
VSWETEKLRRANMSPEQRAAHLKSNREYQARRRAKRTAEQHENEKQYWRDRQANLTNEEREAQRQRGRGAVRDPHELTEADRARSRERNWKRNGFSIELVAQRMKEQSGLCAICRRELGPGRETHADHCHLTNTPRGMLCCRCNTGLGGLQDSPELLRTAALYIEHWQQQDKK